MAALVAVAQIGVVAINAVSRQVVQNLHVGAFADLARQPTDTKWGPLTLFVALFAIGLVVVLWMIVQVVRIPKTADSR
jgi:hypothetical protein